MSLARFVPNPALVAELEASDAYDAARRAVGEVIKANAEAIAPEGTTGEYHRSFYVSEEGSVGTLDPFGHLVEWGSVNNAPYATLRRAVTASGLVLDEEEAPA